MPIHEYKCVKCGHIHNVLEMRRVDVMEVLSKKECEKCSGIIEKVISSGSFRMGEPWNRC